MARKGASEEDIRKKAEAYVDEIAADPHLQMHHFLFYVLKWMFKKVFSGVDLREADFAALKDLGAEKSLILIPCHKSHFDYLLIGFFCFINQMAVPYFAAGKNLSFWPVGSILRNGGAFFLRRTFRGQDVYAQVFAAYLKVLVKEKANIIFYMEGGRSRTGKLLPPKVGLLAFLLETVAEHAVDDLTFVPAFIGYDQIPEETSYLRELAGREKRKETFFEVVRARELLKRSFGKVYVRFDKPVSFREFCGEKQDGTLARRERFQGESPACQRSGVSPHVRDCPGRSGLARRVDCRRSGLFRPRDSPSRLLAFSGGLFGSGSSENTRLSLPTLWMILKTQRKRHWACSSVVASSRTRPLKAPVNPRT